MNAHVRLLTEWLAKAALLSSVADFREFVGDNARLGDSNFQDCMPQPSPSRVGLRR